MEVLVVIATQGEWEDRREWIELLTCSSTKAELYIEDRLAKFKADQNAYERVSSWREQYMESNPSPQLDRTKWKERPRWPAGLTQAQITPEMRAQREAVAAHNQIISDELDAQLGIWQTEFEQACLAFIANEFGVDSVEQQRISELSYKDPLHFHVEKHPLDERS